MPRQAKGPRLFRRRNGVWYIRDDNQVFQSTGTRDRQGADSALARYIVERDRPAGPTAPDRLTVAAALEVYMTERAPMVRDPARIGHAVKALVPILGDLPVGSITGAICRRYGEARAKAPGTVRKELGVLQAAINHCHAEGYLTAAPRVRLPERPAPRDRWLTRDEVAALLRAARSDPRTRHLTRFILLAIYTGTRSESILGLRFMPHLAGGWIDCEAGRMYRRAASRTETKKRQPPIPLPRQLLAHLRRWERNGARFVVEYQGCRVASVKHAWATALAAAGIEHCTRHDLRRTAVTWAMRNGVDKWAACGFFGLTLDVLESTYGHHHPDHLQSAVRAMERRR